MTTIQHPNMIPTHPNLVEIIALLGEPGLKATQRNALERALHNTVRFVKKRDSHLSIHWTAQTHTKTERLV